MSDRPKEPPRRRLGAILFADVADYSRLIGEDETGTSKALQERIATITEQAESHGGKVQQSRGDGLFLLFDSAVDAVAFAVEVQKRMKAVNQGLAQDRQLAFRIGINLGEVLLGAQDSSDDSVNVAAKIATLARPGEVSITAAVYEQVRTRLHLGYSYLGSRTLETISDPVDAFRVHEDPATGPSATSYRRPALLGCVAAETTRGPSVVVLPFHSLGSDPSDSWFADGLTEDITTNLSRFHDLFVIARASARVFGDGAGPPTRATRALGVRYAVTGSVRKAGWRVRVTVQLIDGEHDRAVWGEQYDRQLDDLFDVQQEITEIVASVVAVNIANAERERLRQLAPCDIDAYTSVLRGEQHIFRYTRDDNRHARTLFDRALELDPRYARAIASKSRTLNVDCLFDWAEARDQTLDHALDLALTAVEIDPGDARGFGELGYAHLWRHEHDASISAYRRALHLNPNDADLMSDMAEALAFSGHQEEAVGLLHRAMRLNPYYPDEYLWHLGGAYYDLRRYEEAIQAVSGMQNPRESYRLLAASHAQLGRLNEARAYARKQLEVYPDFNVDRWAEGLPEADEETRQHYIEGLRKAGL